MTTKKAASADRPQIAQVNDNTDFLDPQVRPDGKRRNDPVEVTPATIQQILEKLPPLSKPRAEALAKYSAISPEIVASRPYKHIDDEDIGKFVVSNASGFPEPLVVL